MSIIRVLEMKL